MLRWPPHPKWRLVLNTLEKSGIATCSSRNFFLLCARTAEHGGNSYRVIGRYIHTHAYQAHNSSGPSLPGLHAGVEVAPTRSRSADTPPDTQGHLLGTKIIQHFFSVSGTSPDDSGIKSLNFSALWQELIHQAAHQDGSHPNQSPSCNQSWTHSLL